MKIFKSNTRKRFEKSSFKKLFIIDVEKKKQISDLHTQKTFWKELKHNIDVC